VYTWLDPQWMSYRFGYDSLWSLATLVHAPVRGGCSPSVACSAAPGLQAINIVLDIRRGGRPCHQVPTMGVAKRLNQTVFFSLPGLKGGRSPPLFSLLHLLREQGQTHTRAMSQWQLRRSRESWHGGDGGEPNGCNFRRSRSSLLPVLLFDRGSFLAVT
jgi:hypothetical protein